tara:strand:+ start:1360 stop:1722 length:363 start_codon:yes stop_codon:yes gene_type:complete
MQCPECKTQLGLRATYCGCGWRKAAPKREYSQEASNTPCAHEGCGIAAMAKIKVKTGWASLCWQHYDEHFRVEALASLDKWGMARLADEETSEWVARMRQFVKSGFKVFGNASKSSNTTA